jgi:murein DD-endopeptidase MepM/ murein hydrolase activator NlpD
MLRGRRLGGSKGAKVLAKKSFTLIVVPEHDQAVRRYRVEGRLVRRLLAGGALVVGVLAIAAVHYTHLLYRASENRALRDENVALQAQLKGFRERIEHMASTLERVERFDQKLRAVTLLSDPQRNLALGPTAMETKGAPPRNGVSEFTATSVSMESPKTLAAKLETLSGEASRSEQSLEQLQTYFLEQKSLLASTPSVWPAKGWITSDFGQRTDPYTAERVMHDGLDIAAPHGKDVTAPADGTVIFAGLEGSYGNVLVIDHGYGVKTRYGHLSKVAVHPGDHVRRGELIGAVGNTGRSTGPHLHYEVRVNGLPENPRKFILDDE